MTTWRYALYGLQSRRPIVGHIPWDIGSYSRSLAEAGTLQRASIPLGDERVRAMRLRELVIPRRTTLVILRDEVVQWEGIVWTRRYRASDATMTVAASEIRSYLDHRYLRPEDGPGGPDKILSFTQADQFEIFRALLADAQSITRHGRTVGDIGIEADADHMSGVLRDRHDEGDHKGAYRGTEFKSYGQLLDELAGIENGFEWRIDSYLDSDRRLRRRLVLGYPQVGRPADAGSLVLEYPGQISDYDWDEDSEDSADYVAAIGSNTTPDESVTWGEAWGDDELEVGYPLLEATTSYSTVQRQATIDAHAAADLAARLGDTVIPAVTVHGHPAVSPGDHVRLRIHDEAMFGPRPHETFVRVLGLDVTPGPPETTVLHLQQGRERQGVPRDARSVRRWQRDIARRVSSLEAAR